MSPAVGGHPHSPLRVCTQLAPASPPPLGVMALPFSRGTREISMAQGHGACCAPDNRFPHHQLTLRVSLGSPLQPRVPAGSRLAGVAGRIPPWLVLTSGSCCPCPLPLSLSFSVFWQLVTRQQKNLLPADATSSSPSLAELPGLRPLQLPPLLLPLPFLLWGRSQRVSLWRVQLGPLQQGQEGEEEKSERSEEQVVPGVLKTPRATG